MFRLSETLILDHVFVCRNILKKTQENLDRAYEIIDFAYGPWHEIYREIITKIEIFSSILQNVTDA